MNGKIRTRHHTDLVMHGCFGPYESSKLFTDRSSAPPVDERVEYNLITTYVVRLLVTPKIRYRYPP